MKRILCFGRLSARISFLPGLHTLPFPSYQFSFELHVHKSYIDKAWSVSPVFIITIIYFAFSI